MLAHHLQLCLSTVPFLLYLDAMRTIAHHRVGGALVVLEAQSQTNRHSTAEVMDGVCIPLLATSGDRIHALKAQIEGRIGSEQSQVQSVERISSYVSRPPQMRLESGRDG
jgi:hypothetical protein